MEKKKYIPSEGEIKDFLEKHNLEVWTEQNGQIRLRVCPFCGSGENGKDSKNSGFFISATSGDYQCFRREKCGASGTYRHLQTLMLLRDTDLLTADIQCNAVQPDKALYKKAIGVAKEKGLDIDSYGVKGDGGREYTEEEIAEIKKQERDNRDCTIISLSDIADRDLTGTNYDYLINQRKISPEVCKDYHIVDSGDSDYIFMPHVDLDGETVIFGKLRLNRSGSDDSKEKSAGGQAHFFGLDHLGNGDKLIITEGQIDALSLITAGVQSLGYDVLSVPLGKGNITFISDAEKDILKMYNTIIIYGDLEDGKISMVREFEKLLPDSNVEVIRNYKGCKDANDYLRKYGADELRKAVQDTKEYAPNDIKIKDVDITQQKRERLFTTGINDIDKMINGIEAGNLTLLLAKEGMGKSTIALQLALQAADAGVYSYIYSGEIAVEDTVKTLLLQSAGPLGVAAHKDPVTGIFTSSLRIPSYQDKIIDYLDRYITIYNPITTYTPRFGEKFGETAYTVVNTLIEEVENKARKGKIRFYIIDNMMSLLTAAGEGNELFCCQGLLAQKLKDISVKYNVAILLCVHSRKSALGQSYLTADDISGSSTVKNMADVIISLEKFNPKEEKKNGKVTGYVYPQCCVGINKNPNTQLRVLKNRYHSLKHDQDDGCLIWYVAPCKSIFDADTYKNLQDNKVAPQHGWQVADDV